MSVAVLLAIDSTGSMRWVHKTLCENIGSILQQFDNEGVPAQFSLVGFRDYQAESSSWLESMDFSSEEDVSEYVTWLSNLKAKGGGGNQAESSMAGMIHGILNFEWPEVKRKVVAIFTDDNPHVPDIGVESWNQIQDVINSNDIAQVHLFVDEKHEDGYDELDHFGFQVLRHTLVKDDRTSLEESIRKFVKVSSAGCGGFGGDVDLIDRETSENPFDLDVIEPTDSEDSIESPEDFDPDANPFDEW